MAILSFRNAVSEIDVLEEQRKTLANTLSRCVQSAGQYAVELGPEAAGALRDDLDRLSQQVGSLTDLSSHHEFHTAFRGELRSYRDRTQAQIERLREEMAATMETVQTFMTSVSTTSSEHEAVIRVEFQHLDAAAEKAAAANNVAIVRAAIHEAAAKALESCEQVQRTNQVVIAQLQDEIRNLHREVDRKQRDAETDPGSSAWNRAKVNSRIQDLFLLNESFSVILVGITNWEEVTRQCAKHHILPECLQSVAGRLRTLAGPTGLVGRWSDEIFCIVFNLPLRSLPVSTQEIVAALSAPLSIMVDGSPHKVTLTVKAQAIERPQSHGEAGFYGSLGQAVFSVSTT